MTPARCGAGGRRGAPCRGAVPPGSPVPLCPAHLVLAADWVAGELGVPDALERPCAACGSRVGTRFPSGTLCGVCEWRVGDVPDLELGPARVEVVYYLRVADRVKIGTTGALEQRMRQLRHDELLAIEPGGVARERRRHERFAELRYDRTEWFRLGPALRAHLAELTTLEPDPWAHHARLRASALALRA
ncbi:GIY-YIG nuclease family protein [Homoserinibacter sp. YIM 151385]|uniref:GIY-YIG nuclease family protein n=1 Tax=Homoserinibacter sp. YIM 151385 TaxID=2985506 RepID=UPI0022F0458B|nr:GIY-YIG nuclease family protein [Homoserinibacter sp. YIM 151385]WBU37615.1 GIY-YIG nuclease family protein [Homoserinibacter sp. YIM 151385]